MKISFLDLLTVSFVVLKLTNVINWSWWLVLAPTLIPLAIGFGLFLLGLLIVFAEELKKINHIDIYQS